MCVKFFVIVLVVVVVVWFGECIWFKVVSIFGVIDCMLSDICV